MESAAAVATPAVEVWHGQAERVPAIELPEAARRLLEDLLRVRQQAEREIEVAVAGVRTALGVPAGWVLLDLSVGFVQPPAAGEG
jgi:hypothetical protein